MSLFPIRVLVVDDHEDGANTLAMVFRLDGHAVVVAHDGRTAIESACDARPDLVLLDLSLGSAPDGFEVARHLRDVLGLDHARLVAVTGHGTEEHRRRAAEAGFDLFLLKPVGPADLRRLTQDLPRPFPAALSSRRRMARGA
jgi:CheY-like chemotaxis protein